MVPFLLLYVPPAIGQLLDTQRNKLAGAEAPASVQGALHAVLQHVIKQTFVDSFRLAMWIGVGLALTSALCAFLLVEGKSASNSE